MKYIKVNNTTVLLLMLWTVVCAGEVESVSVEIQHHANGHLNIVIPKSIWSGSKYLIEHGHDFDAITISGESNFYGMQMYFGSAAQNLQEKVKEKEGKILSQTKGRINGDDVVWFLADIPLVNNGHTYWSWVTMQTTINVNEKTGEVTGREGYQIMVWDKSVDMLKTKIGLLEGILRW